MFLTSKIRYFGYRKQTKNVVLTENTVEICKFENCLYTPSGAKRRNELLILMYDNGYKHLRLKNGTRYLIL